MMRIMMKNTNLSRPFFLTLIFVALLMVIMYQSHQISILKLPQSATQCPLSNDETLNLENIKKWTQLFYDIGSKHGTDKIFNHNYHNVYGIYLGSRRFEKIKLLEIGLGCTMNYGPGKSLLTWREYAPNAHITVLEYDEKCATALKSQVDQLFTGDQSDFEILKNVAKGGPYDIVIDDGGHTRKQQVNSLIGLWESVKSGGGIYVIEDMHVSFVQGYMDHPFSSYDVVTKLIYLFLDDSKSGINNPLKWEISDEIRSIFKSLLSINCFQHSCVLVKK